MKQSSTNDAMLEAQANARMALQLAIGELQASMGPDRRISARASTLVKDARVGASLVSSNPRSWWVGVVGSDPELGLDASNPVSATNPAARWLVSGLDPKSPAATQLGQNFSNPVKLFDAYSIDLTQTGGQPLEAGIVRTAGSKQGHLGGYAWMVDDEGLKATLAPGDSRLVNTDEPSRQSDLSPGAYDVSVLEGMAGLSGNPLSNFAKIISVGDLSLVGGNTKLAANKRLGYTTLSRGLLCDVKNGGLKRDLTVAFEDEATFAEVFPRGTGNYTADYLCIDPEKLAASADLQENGYIHWEVFKDFYNIKRHIKTAADGTKYLDPVRYTKAGTLMANNGHPNPGWSINPAGDPAGHTRGSLFMAGRLGPHQIGVSETAQYPEAQGLPYGDYQVEWERNGQLIARQPKNHKEFKHSPVMPILQRFQTNAWMEQMDNRTLRTHAQVWSSHYNPYNIGLYAYGDSGGPRILGTPEVTAFSQRLDSGAFEYKHENFNVGPRIETAYLRDLGFTSNKWQFNADHPIMLLPGRSHVLAYEKAAEIGVDRTQDSFLYDDKVKDLTVESVYRDLVYHVRNPDWTRGGDEPRWIPADLPPSFDMKILMNLKFASLHTGVDDNSGGGGNFEVCQSFWAPFAWDEAKNRPGKVFDLGTVSAATLNENLMARLGFNLRTTREADGIRPLVDSNIRCMFGNTRWDSPLGVSLLAAYSPVNQGVADEMVMQMDTVDAPRGYSYWGADRDSFNGYSRVILFDIPRSDLVSLGQLQHASAGRFSYEPTYIVGNSYANPRISQTEWVESITDSFSTAARGLDIFAINGGFNLYDASYLVNEVLWDSYTFTTIPQVADNADGLEEDGLTDAHFEDLLRGDAQLANGRLLPYVPPASSFDRATLQMESSRADGTGAFYHNAGHVLVDGAFNVNSTSVDAWEAFLSSTHSLPFAKMNEDGEVASFETTSKVRFPRVQTVFGGAMSKEDMDENFWTGFRELEQSEVRELAEAIVEEVEKRGPFLSLGSFVNRRLEDGELGEMGALQAALDATVNQGIDPEFAAGEQGAGFPGQLLQGDILQALGPRMTVRSDVFTIRAYGECISETTGEILARAWCEAKVQRYPDPVNWNGSGNSSLEELANPSSPFGRRFDMISFRWLNPEEI
ncbi:MAG: hypothetical protein R3242_07490 [Akkermansiaceae bacterium]|nr:hypothetical protein [Akkermansiaceae bacterium]